MGLLHFQLLIIPFFIWLVIFLINSYYFLKKSSYNNKFNLVILSLYFWLLQITTIFNFIVYYNIRDNYLSKINQYDINIYLFLLYITIIYISIISYLSLKSFNQKKFKLHNILSVSFLCICLSNILVLTGMIIILSK